MKTKTGFYLLSELEEIILSVLWGRSELYGCQMIKIIEAGSDDKLKISFGSLYAALQRLEAQNLVISRWEAETSDRARGPRRKYYTITTAGEEALTEKRMIRAGIAACDR